MLVNSVIIAENISTVLDCLCTRQ